MGFDRWRQARDEVKELDLIPIMNLMVTLIPFLMLGAAFYHIGVIPTSLPAEAAGPPPSEIPVTASVQIAADGALTVGILSPELTPEVLAALGRSLPPVGEGPDLAGLTAHLSTVKARYPKSDTVLLVPAPTVPYQRLVDVLDAARERLGPTGAPEAVLFPVAVFSKRLEAPAEAPGEGEAGEAEGAPAEDPPAADPAEAPPADPAEDP